MHRRIKLMEQQAQESKMLQQHFFFFMNWDITCEDTIYCNVLEVPTRSAVPHIYSTKHLFMGFIATVDKISTPRRFFYYPTFWSYISCKLLQRRQSVFRITPSVWQDVLTHKVYTRKVVQRRIERRGRVRPADPHSVFNQAPLAAAALVHLKVNGSRRSPIPSTATVGMECIVNFSESARCPMVCRLNSNDVPWQQFSSVRSFWIINVEGVGYIPRATWHKVFCCHRGNIWGVHHLHAFPPQK